MLFMISENLNKEAINTQRRLGLSCSSQTAYRHLRKVEQTYLESLESFIDEAIENGYLIVANLDDYHNIHTSQRPKEDKASTATHIATAVIRIFKNIKALKRSQVTQVHNPLGVTPRNCIDNITSNDNMERFSKSFVDTMPQWLKEQFFIQR